MSGIAIISTTEELFTFRSETFARHRCKRFSGEPNPDQPSMGLCVLHFAVHAPQRSVLGAMFEFMPAKINDQWCGGGEHVTADA